MHLVESGRLDEALDIIVDRARRTLDTPLSAIADGVRMLLPGWQVFLRRLIEHAKHSGRPAEEAHLVLGVIVSVGALTSDTERADWRRYSTSWRATVATTSGSPWMTRSAVKPD